MEGPFLDGLKPCFVEEENLLSLLSFLPASSSALLVFFACTYKSRKSHGAAPNISKDRFSLAVVCSAAGLSTTVSNMTCGAGSLIPAPSDATARLSSCSCKS